MTDKEKLARMLEQTIAQIGGFGVPRSDARRMAADLMVELEAKEDGERNMSRMRVRI